MEPTSKDLFTDLNPGTELALFHFEFPALENWITLLPLALGYPSHFAERILNKIANAISKTFKELKFILQGFRINLV